jgi:hypothetical protein
VFIAGPGDLAPRLFANLEGSFQFDAKPGAEFVVIGQSTPNARDGRMDLDGFLDAVRSVMSNLQVA